MANPEYHSDFWLAAATIGPVVFLAVVVVAGEAMRRANQSSETTAKRVVWLGVYIVSLGAALLAVTVTTDAAYALARESDTGLSLSPRAPRYGSASCSRSSRS